MTLQERALLLLDGLRALYPDALCSLSYEKDYELLFATRLAAQCTDARVNTITPTLYARYPSLEALAGAEISELEEIIRPCGFFHTKARDIQACAAQLLEKHGGCVPDTMEALLALPGVGRKTANLILGDVYGKGGIVVDTHCLRLADRFGLCHHKDPVKMEFALDALIPRAEQSSFCHRLVLHGRALCMARAPRCADCALRPHCVFGTNQPNSNS